MLARLSAHRRIYFSPRAFSLTPIMATDTPLLKKRKVSPEPEDGVQTSPVVGLRIKRHSEKAKLPTRGSALAAGYDLYRYALVLSHSVK